QLTTSHTTTPTLSLHDALPISKKIVTPDDIKGMKIRPAHATMANFVTQLGGTNVQSSAPEVRDIIERGVADAVTKLAMVAWAGRDRKSTRLNSSHRTISYAVFC